MATILETLQNAKINLIDNASFEMAVILGKTQLKNAVELLNKGYDLDYDIDDVVESIPFK